jgi:hypothetical protein
LGFSSSPLRGRHSQREIASKTKKRGAMRGHS